MKKKQYRHGSFIAILCLTLVATLLLSCGGDNEGCLDIDATNFDVTADVPCLDCCEFPNFIVAFSYTWDSLTYQSTNLYTSPDQDSVQILDAQVLLSNFELRSLGNSIRVEDTITLPLLLNGMDSLEADYVDDFNRVGRSFGFSYTIGKLASLQTVIDSIYFQIGLEPSLVDVDTSAMPSGHPLTNAIPDLYDAPGTGFQSIRFEVLTDTSAALNPDTLIYNTGLNVTRLVGLEINQQVDRGFDFNVSIRIDYQKWFEGINFDVDQQSLIEEKLLENATAAFSIID